MQLAMATDYIGYTNDREEIRATLKKINEAGFTHVHWCHDWDGPHLYEKEELARIRDALSEYGLLTKGVHATDGRYYHGKEGMFKTLEQYGDQPCYFSFSETIRKQGEALLLNRLELAALLEAQEIVLHMQLPYVQFETEEGCEERFYTQAFKSLDAVESFARTYGIRICFENLPGTPNGIQMEQFDRIFARYDAGFAGLCCDTGHGFLTDASDPFCFAKRYPERLFMMHLNDNHGYPVPGDFSNDTMMAQSDEHHVMGDGVIPFEEFAAVTAASAYEGPVVGEFVVHGETEEAFLAKCLRRLERFTLQLDEFRSSRPVQTSRALSESGRPDPEEN